MCFIRGKQFLYGGRSVRRNERGVLRNDLFALFKSESSGECQDLIYWGLRQAGYVHVVVRVLRHCQELYGVAWQYG